MVPRTPLLLVAVGSLLLAGCNGSLGDQPSTATSPVTPTGTIDPAQLPPDGEAEERALAAETRYVSAKLRNASCLSDWGIGEFTASAEAVVTNRTARGVLVNVTRPYAWERGGSKADVISTARYLVTDNETIRLSGTVIDPC